MQVASTSLHGLVVSLAPPALKEKLLSLEMRKDQVNIFPSGQWSNWSIRCGRRGFIWYSKEINLHEDPPLWVVDPHLMPLYKVDRLIFPHTVEQLKMSQHFLYLNQYKGSPSFSFDRWHHLSSSFLYLLLHGQVQTQILDLWWFLMLVAGPWPIPSNGSSRLKLTFL